MLDLYLHTKVESPVTINDGDTGLLKVEKSESGVLWWIHQGAIVRGQDEHYSFPDTEQGSTGTTLQISKVDSQHAGVYEILLKEAGCEIRNVIDVHIFGEYWKVRDKTTLLILQTCFDGYLQCNLKSIYNFDNLSFLI